MSDAKAQQEPSMEEILASIRRIIADDPVRTPRHETPRGEPLRGEKTQTNDGLYRGRPPVSAPREGLSRPLPPRDDASQSFPRPFSSERAGEGNTGAAPPSRPASFLPGAMPQPSILSSRAEQPSAAPPEPMSPQQEIDAMLAELNSRTRVAAREPEPEEPAADNLELTEEVPVEEPPADLVSSHAQLFEDVSAAEGTPPSAAALNFEVRGEELAEEEEEVAPEEMQPHSHAAEHEGEQLPDPRQPFAASGMDEGLISSNTTAAVDSAFNALAQTVLVQNARTLEDLVREMLRPMLKIWLDDNLPGLVERLVRAEIERVSRGRG
jgi:cell pole-organizing protein PopZ